MRVTIKLFYRLFIIACILIFFMSCRQNKIFKERLSNKYLSKTDLLLENGNLVYLDTNYTICNYNIKNNYLNWLFYLDTLELFRMKLINENIFISGIKKGKYLFWIIDIDSGKIKYHKKLKNRDIYHLPLSLNDELIFIASTQNIIKCNLLSDSCKNYDLNIEGFGIPNNLLFYGNNFYTTLKGNILEINSKTFNISDTIPLNFKFQGIYFFNAIIKDDLIIPNEDEVIVYDLKSKRIKLRYLLSNEGKIKNDCIKEVVFNEKYILIKSIMGNLHVIDIESCKLKTIIETSVSSISYEKTVEIYGDYIVNYLKNKIQIINLNSNDITIYDESKSSPFIIRQKEVLFINSENELCKIDLNDLE